MKPILSVFISMVLFFSVATVPVVVMTGCKQSQVQIAYKSLKSVQEASVGGLVIYGNAFKAGKITPEQRVQVLDAYQKYQAGFGLALEAAQFNWETRPTAELTKLIQTLLLTIDSFSK